MGTYSIENLIILIAKILYKANAGALIIVLKSAIFLLKFWILIHHALILSIELGIIRNLTRSCNITGQEHKTVM